MSDPSQGVSRDLIPHVHLISTYRFPVLQQLHHEKVAQWLLGAPKIARDQAAFYWTYLDRPVDGSIFLVWQAPSMGTEYPSDGYIWAPGENAYQIEINGGYTLEMYNAKSGYANGDAYATHARRRYRLLPSRNPAPNSPAPDQNMWIIHYCQAAREDRAPYNVIPVDMRTQNMLNTRSYLKSQGQIVQKEFMLYDRTNWPQIAFPRGQQRSVAYGAGNMPPRVPQSMAYPPQAMAGPPSKRARIDDGGSMTVAVGHPNALVGDDDEDTTSGDYWDMITPREISEARYVQNHLWMEEIINSQYPSNRIVPSDLGLGLRGELSHLTEGIFDAPIDVYDEKAKQEHVYIGRLQPGKADEFRKRIDEHVVNTNKEIEKLRSKHEKRLAKFKKNGLLDQAELELRTAIDDPSDMGTDYWRLEGKIETDENGEEMPPTKPLAKVDEIVAQVVASLDLHTNNIQQLRRIQDGGYEETITIPTPQISRQPSRVGSHRSGSGVLIGDADIDMGGSAAGLLDQFHTGMSSNPSPGSNMHTPHTHLTGLSAAGTPLNINASSPHLLQSEQQENVTMPDATSAPPPPPSATISHPGSDWVVIPEGGASPEKPSDDRISHNSATQATDPAVATITTTSLPDLPSVSVAAAISVADAPLMDNDFSDLADLDSAGDALANFEADVSHSPPVVPHQQPSSGEREGDGGEKGITPRNEIGDGGVIGGEGETIRDKPGDGDHDGDGDGDGGMGDLDLQMEGVGDLEMGDMPDLGPVGDESAFGAAFGMGEGPGPGPGAGVAAGDVDGGEQESRGGP